MQAATRKIESKLNSAKVDHAMNVMNADNRLDLDHDVRTKTLAQELEEKKASSELSNPDEW